MRKMNKKITWDEFCTQRHRGMEFLKSRRASTKIATSSTAISVLRRSRSLGLTSKSGLSEKEKRLKIDDFQPLYLVGATGLEPATSRPPDVCATNCAKPRSLQVAELFSAFAGAKVRSFCETSKFFRTFFPFFSLFSNIMRKFAVVFSVNSML